MEITNN